MDSTYKTGMTHFISKYLDLYSIKIDIQEKVKIESNALERE